MKAAEQVSALESILGDRKRRIQSLYKIRDKSGAVVPFRLNWAQERLFDEMHYLNIILKARQLGFSTFIQIFMLDAALFRDNTRCGTIAHTREAAEDIFGNIVKFAYDNLPDAIKALRAATQDSARKLQFSNGSSIQVGTSLRSGTFQYLHISEFGKVCAKDPGKAQEIVTGALNTIEAGQVGFIESTAEGREGRFFEMCQDAQIAARSGAKLTPLDWKFFFFGWHQNPTYAIESDGVVSKAIAEYRAKLASGGIDLTDAQIAWYAKKKQTQQDDMMREFPSTADEAFHASVEGAYYATQFARIDEDKRVRSLPVADGTPVHTLWDLGLNDEMCIWFLQVVGPNWHLIDFYKNTGEGLAHYAQYLQDVQRRRGLVYGRHLWPHDGNARVLDERGRKRADIMAGLGYRVDIVKRNTSVLAGIEDVRRVLSICYFDEEHCSEGVAALRSYRKDWDDKLGVFKNHPRHDASSNPADAFRTGAEGQAMLGGRRRGHVIPEGAHGFS